MLQYQIIPVTPFQQNCTLIWCDQTGQAALIDAGGESERLLEQVRKRGLKLEKLWVTHGHIDHVGAVGSLHQQGHWPIEGPHQGDDYWLDLVPEAARNYGFPAAVKFQPDRWLDDADQVTLGKETLEILHCPGHTPGHVVFFHRNQGVAWVGDVLFAGSVGRSDFPGGDGPTLIRSIRDKLFPLGADVRFVPGHGPMSSFAEERQRNPFVADRLFPR